MDQEEQAAAEVDLDDFAEASAQAADPRRRSQRRQSKERRQQVSGGRVALLISAMIPAFGMIMFGLIWLLSRSDLALYMVLGNLFVALVYTGLYIWARKQPIRGLQAGCQLVYLLLAIEIGLVVNDPSFAFVSALIMRIYTLQLLLKGLKAAKKREAIKERATLAA